MSDSVKDIYAVVIVKWDYHLFLKILKYLKQFYKQQKDVGSVKEKDVFTH